MAGKQTLRWWQEAVPATHIAPPTPVAATESETVADATLDLWDTLEAEARARAVAEAQGERVVIPFRNGYDTRWLWREMSVIIAVRLFLVFCSSWGMLVSAIFTSHRSLPLILLLGLCSVVITGLHLIEVVRMCSKARRQFAHQQAEPAIVLSPEGMGIHTSDLDIALLPWQDIAEVKVASYKKEQWLAIVPKDADALAARWGKQVRPPNFRLLPRDIPVNAIRISQRDLPLTAEALLARIAAFEPAVGLPKKTNGGEVKNG